MIKPTPITKAQQDRLKILVYGQSGTGKSTLATSIAAQQKVLYLDFPGELGLLTLSDLDYAGNIDRQVVDSIAQLDEVYKLLGSGEHPYDAVVVDTVSSVQLLFSRQIQGLTTPVFTAQGPGMDQKRWGAMLGHMSEFLIYMYGLSSTDAKKPINVIMTAQVTSKDDKITGVEKIQPAIQGGALVWALAAPDFILYTFIGDDSVHQVRLGPHPTITTKIRRSVQKQPLPATVRGLTIPKFATLIGKELSNGRVNNSVPTKSGHH